MKTIRVGENENLFKLAAREYLNVAGVFAFALLNGLSVTDVPAPGAELQVDDSLKFKPYESPEAERPIRLDNSWTVRNGQSLFDIAVQKAGSVEAVVELALLNGKQITQVPAAGEVLGTDLQVVRANVAGEILRRGLVINNSNMGDQLPQGWLWVDGDESFILDGNDDYILTE